ncbi:MAG: hypothetical protein QM766_22295 [Burkholderiaceae bacterium]
MGSLALQRRMPVLQCDDPTGYQLATLRMHEANRLTLMHRTSDDQDSLRIGQRALEDAVEPKEIEAGGALQPIGPKRSPIMLLQRHQSALVDPCTGGPDPAGSSSR